MVIDPEDKALPDQILMGDRTIRPIKQAPTPQETVNFVFLANSLTTRNKNAANVSVITSHVLTTKDNYTGQKLTLQLKMPMPLKIMVNPMMEIVWFFVKSIMAPLMNAPSVIPQLILNLCTISITTCNKFLNQMTPFNGDKVRPRITARAGGQTFSLLFDTGASITCMTALSFYAAFPHAKPHRVQDAQHCTAASGDKMKSLGIFEIDLHIKGKIFTHHINVIDKLTYYIIGIDFMHKHKLPYDMQTKQVKIASIDGLTEIKLWPSKNKFYLL
jgi:Retroviral aspartyl protease